MTNEEAKVFLDNLKICINEHPIVADWLVEIADRKDEPQNYCDDCLYTDTCDSKAYFYACTSKATISKMEQVDEPQTYCGDFADRLAYERGVKHAWEVAQKVFNSTVTFYEAEDVAKQIDKDINVRSKTEPQTEEEYINNLPWTEVGNGEQTENLFTDKDGDVWEWRGDAWYCISGDEPQTERRE